MKELTFIDLFAGAGGLSEGFVRAGFNPVAHVEMDTAACFTLQTRIAYHHLKSSNQFDAYLSYLKGEIDRNKLYRSVPEKLLKSVINKAISTRTNLEIQSKIDEQLKGRQVDLIVGGPPCQAYSIVGRARSRDKMVGDPRNFLFFQYARYLEKYQPKLFVFENVLGLKSAQDGKYLNQMRLQFYSQGYKLQLYTVEANKFGVLQNRKRIILIGWKENLDFKIPELEAIDLRTNHTVGEILNDMPELGAGDGVDKYQRYKAKTNPYLTINYIRNGIDILTQHVARPHTEQDKEIYRIAVAKWNENKERLNYVDLPENLRTHRNQHSFFDRFKVVAANESHSQTVVAHISKDGHYYIHPDIEQNRSLTVREAARLQSFPDDYYFEGFRDKISRTAAYKQIGNAVPPLMAERIAKLIKNAFQFK